MSDARTSEQLSEAYGYLRLPEVKSLKAAVRALEGSYIHAVNFGAGPGTSGMALIESREDLHVTTIDIEGGVSPTGGLGNEALEFERAAVPKERYTHIIGDSADIAASWLTPVDVVFLDGDHSYEHALADIRGWWKHLRVGGIMAVHDYGKAGGSDIEVWGAVKSAIDDFLSENAHSFVSHEETLLIVKKVAP